MRSFYYKIALVAGLLYFISPFLNRGAESLWGRAESELLGIFFVAVSLWGLRSLKKGPAYLLALGGIFSIIWAGVGPWFHHFAGAFDCLLFGLFYLFLYWLITRTPIKSELSSYPKLKIDNTSYVLEDMQHKQGDFLLSLEAIDDESDKKELSLSASDLVGLAAQLDSQACAQSMRSLVKGAEELLNSKKVRKN